MADTDAQPTFEGDPDEDELTQAELDAQREAEAGMEAEDPADTDEQATDDADVGDDGDGPQAGRADEAAGEAPEIEDTYLTRVTRTVDYQELNGIRREIVVTATIEVGDDEPTEDEITAAVLDSLRRDYSVDPTAPPPFVVG